MGLFENRDKPLSRRASCLAFGNMRCQTQGERKLVRSCLQLLLALALALMAVVVACSHRSVSGQHQINIAAADDLTESFTEAARVFESETGLQVKCTFGPSSELAKLITHGAAFDLFAADSI